MFSNVAWLYDPRAFTHDLALVLNIVFLLFCPHFRCHYTEEIFPENHRQGEALMLTFRCSHFILSWCFLVLYCCCLFTCLYLPIDWKGQDHICCSGYLLAHVLGLLWWYPTYRNQNLFLLLLKKKPSELSDIKLSSFCMLMGIHGSEI